MVMGAQLCENTKNVSEFCTFWVVWKSFLNLKKNIQPIIPGLTGWQNEMICSRAGWEHCRAVPSRGQGLPLIQLVSSCSPGIERLGSHWTPLGVCRFTTSASKSPWFWVILPGFSLLPQHHQPSDVMQLLKGNHTSFSTS